MSSIPECHLPIEQFFIECQVPPQVLNTLLGAVPWWHLESDSVISQKDWDMGLFQPTLPVISRESHCPSQNEEVSPDGFQGPFQLLNLKF